MSGTSLHFYTHSASVMELLAWRTHGPLQPAAINTLWNAMTAVQEDTARLTDVLPVWCDAVRTVRACSCSYKSDYLPVCVRPQSIAIYQTYTLMLFLCWNTWCMWPLACWDCGFESHRGHRCPSVGQVEVSATSWSLVQRSPTDCGA